MSVPVSKKSAPTTPVAVPNKRMLQTLIALGWVLIVATVCLAGYKLWNNVMFPTYYYDYTGEHTVSTGVAWYLLLFAFVSGVILTLVSYTRYDRYFLIVASGVITCLDTRGGGHSSLQWYVWLEGQTLSGETNVYGFPVNAGHWRDLKVGQHYTR